MFVLIGLLTGVVIFFAATRPGASLMKSVVLLPPAGTASAVFPQVLPLPKLTQPMVLLLMGVDSNGLNNPHFDQCRSDTMILAFLNPHTKQVGLVSLPRDSRVNVPGHGTQKINAAHALGGPELAVQTVRETFLVPIDRYVTVDSEGLKGLFAALGPIEVIVEKEMHYRDRAAHLNIQLSPGKQILSPEQVEEYVRFRHDARGDIGRMERQQWFLRQVASKAKDPELWLKIPELIALALQYVRTDMSVEEMTQVASFLKDVDPSEIRTGTIPGEAAMIAGGSYWLPDLAASQIVLNRALGLNVSAPMMDQGCYAAASEQKPLTVAIRYPRGCKDQADSLERAFNKAGYIVKYKWPVELSECQHEQIVQNSSNADDKATDQMRKDIPELRSWSIVLALESRPLTDFTAVISAQTRLASHLEAGSPHTVQVKMLADQ